MNLIDKIKNKDSIIGIFGMGYVGLPLALSFVEKGFNVFGIEATREKVSLLQDGLSYIKHISNSRIDDAVRTGNFIPIDVSERHNCDIYIICVPTPLNKHKEPEMKYILSALEAINPKEKLIILESTTYPGTTSELVKGRLEKSGCLVGEDFFLAFSPEREDPGNKNFNTVTIPKIVGGHTEKCLDLSVSLYEQIMEKVIPVSSTQVAEMTKLLENTFRGVNIALVNELKILCDAMKIDIWEVIDAAASKPFGFMPFYPGPGLGGHCIPIDPFYLSWKAKEYDMTTRFIELSGQINTRMHHYVIEKLTLALNDQEKSIKNSSILVLGIAYKKNIDDVRESPALVILDMLSDLGAKTYFYDEHVTVDQNFKHKRLDNLNDLESKKFDAAVIVTEHSNVDYDFILREVHAVVDCRNALKGRADKKIYKA